MTQISYSKTGKKYKIQKKLENGRSVGFDTYPTRLWSNWHWEPAQGDATPSHKLADSGLSGFDPTIRTNPKGFPGLYQGSQMIRLADPANHA